ncbi:DUF1353 domain-containing protein [Campylobacter insulaenigrae]|uniref:DUF1353 domain-containing protein n=1 Tax=Campylobacter insulaenigrae TaxID=260714 RepID=UPI0021533C87|nr:DUF1353 domain-containing protein [Campylobacter insulaenigrae]MCR6593631.1 DUF1353 domain-containing protein [Campylobacter insulaenigrae]
MIKNNLKRVIVKPFNKDRFELQKEFEVSLCNLKITIPKGFTSNGANIPRIFWSIFPPNSPEYLSAVVVHDYLCQKSNSRDDYKIADLALKEAMQELGCSRFKTFVFYHACNGFHIVKCFFKGI